MSLTLFNDLEFNYNHVKEEVDYKIRMFDQEEKENGKYELNKKRAEEIIGHEAEPLGRMFIYEFGWGISKTEYEEQMKLEPWIINDRHVMFYNFIQECLFCDTYHFLFEHEWDVYKRSFLKNEEVKLNRMSRRINCMKEVNTIIIDLMLNQNVLTEDDRNNYIKEKNYTTLPGKILNFNEDFNYIFPEMKQITVDFISGELLTKKTLIRNKNLIASYISPETIYDKLTEESQDQFVDVILELNKKF